MSDSNIEESSEQTHGGETNPTTHGREMKDMSHDVFIDMKARLAKVE